MSCDGFNLYNAIDTELHKILFKRKTNDFSSEIISNFKQKIWWFRFESFETGTDSYISKFLLKFSDILALPLIVISLTGLNAMIHEVESLYVQGQSY